MSGWFSSLYEIVLWVLALWFIAALAVAAFFSGQSIVRTEPLIGKILYLRLGWGTFLAAGISTVAVTSNLSDGQSLFGKWVWVVFFFLLGPALIGARREQKRLQDLADNFNAATEQAINHQPVGNGVKKHGD